MHAYLHNIKTFNNATRHLTRVERSLYRDATELYYDTEQPLPADDFDKLARRLLAHSDEEKAALRYVLDEFFVRTGDVYTHDYCDALIEKYQGNSTAKANAGKASAAKRKKKAEARKQQRQTNGEQKSTGDQQPLNGCSTLVANHEPLTINHEPLTNIKEDLPPGDSSPSQVAKADPVPFEQIVAKYHEILPTLPRCVKLSPARKGNIRQRHNEDVKTIERWEEFFHAVSRSDFLMGRKPGTGDKPPFMADLEWITKQGNFLKIAEGRYHRG
jgi:uncharacterized protein YdaU (DUF1376 family)